VSRLRDFHINSTGNAAAVDEKTPAIAGVPRAAAKGGY